MNTIGRALRHAEKGDTLKLYSLKGENFRDLQETLADPNREQLVIESVNLKGKDLRGLVLRNLRFTAGDFEGADLSDSVIERVEFEGTWLCEVQLSRARLSKVEFYDVQAYEANFLSASFDEVKFLGSNLSLSNFCDCTLKNVIFGHDNINHFTNIAEADLSKADLSGVQFFGAEYDAETKFPSGFDPSVHPKLRLTV